MLGIVGQIGAAFRTDYQQNPVVLVDVGAAGGLDEKWEPARQYLRVIGFEPNRQSYGELVIPRPGDRYLNTALSNEPGTAIMYFTKSPNQSSLLKPDQLFLNKFPAAHRYEIVATEEVATDTLDHQMEEEGIKKIDFVKLDTQGSERFILEGAENILRDAAFGVEVEVAFTPRYLDQPLFSDIDGMLRRLGYQLFDIRPVYLKRTSGQRFGGPKGQLITGEALYLKPPEGLAALLELIPGEAEKKSKVLNALLICFVYGYLDYALECIQSVGALLSGKDRQLLIREIETNVSISHKMPVFKGRSLTSKILHRLWMTFQVHEGGYDPRGRQLGNL